MKYNNKIQIGFLLRNYRLKGEFYVKDKKVYIISSLLCHRLAIKKINTKTRKEEKKWNKKHTTTTTIEKQTNRPIELV